MTEKSAKLKSVLLVDDDQATNYFHRLIIKDAISETNVTIAIDGEHALEYILQSGINLGRKKSLEIPNLIVLDLNMPRMDGFAFLSVVNGLPDEIKSKISVVVLTSEKNEQTLSTITSYNTVKGVLQKPLCKEQLLAITNDFSVNEVAA